jgi:hypothetical protein
MRGVSRDGNATAPCNHQTPIERGTSKAPKKGKKGAQNRKN